MRVCPSEYCHSLLAAGTENGKDEVHPSGAYTSA